MDDSFDKISAQYLDLKVRRNEEEWRKKKKVSCDVMEDDYCDGRIIFVVDDFTFDI